MLKTEKKNNFNSNHFVFFKSIHCDPKGGPSFGEAPSIQRGNISNG